MKRIQRALATLLCLLAAGQAFAQAAAYPSKSVRILVPMVAGGAPDVIARALGQVLTERNGQTFFVENKPDANTIIATDTCAKAPPDGATLCVITSSSLSINPHVYRKLPYNPGKDFEPVTPLAVPDMVLVASPSLPVATLPELIAHARKHPGKLSFSSFGIGSDTHVTMEWLKRQARIDLLHVPFNGFGPMLQAFNTGDVHLMYLSVGNPGVVAQIKSGKMKALAVFAPSRSQQLPEVPTLDEMTASLGIERFQGHVWFGLLAPAGTPKPIVAQLNGQIAEALQSPALRTQLATMAMRTRPQSPAEFAEFLGKDRKVWGDLLSESRLAIE